MVMSDIVPYSEANRQLRETQEIARIYVDGEPFRLVQHGRSAILEIRLFP